MMNRIITIILCLFGIFPVQANDFAFTPIDVSKGLSDNQIRYILQLPDGRMVFTTNGNINFYDGTRFKYVHRDSRHIYPLSKYDGFYRIYRTGDSLLWVKDNHKLLCLNLYKEQYITDIAERFRSRGITEPVEDLFVDERERMWLRTSRGLIQYNNSELIDINTEPGNLQDLAAEKDSLYLFYNTGEVVCYNTKTRKKLYRQPAYPLHEQGLFKNTSLVIKGKNGFYQLRNGSKGGFFFFDPKTEIWKKILETDYTLNTLLITPDETAYISSSRGLWIIKLQNGEKNYLPVLKTVEGNIIDTEISTLFYDKQGGLWLGTVNRGLLYYHPSRYKFTYIGRSYFPNTTTKDIIVQRFTEDKNGNIYLKSQTEIYRYHSQTEKDKALTSVSPNSLPIDLQQKLGENYTDSLRDIRGWIWTGTPDGLKLFEPKTRKEKIFYTEEGLSNNFIHALLEDRNHDIWATTGYGISQIKVDSITGDIHFTNFNTYDGTLTGEYAPGSALEATDGTLYFGGVNGFNVLTPNSMTSDPLPFKPVFTNLLLRGEKVEIGKSYEGRIILSETAPYTRQIELSHHQNFLTFEYSALNYLNPHQTHYRYRLEGIDKDWQEISPGKQHRNSDTDGILRASYTNLPAGKYTFKVMASNNKHPYNESVSELKIIIHSPWWKTPVAYILYTVFILSVIFTSVYSYIRISKKKLERRHKEEILLLRMRNLIEQCNRLEAEKESYLTKSGIDTISEKNNPSQPSADSIFLSRAIKLVEENLDLPGYSVEQLSRDLCMDRTGLYRKLITLLDKSPSLFIRQIRLQKAAQLILEEKLSITEIAEKVGFSSSSYLSKCFQEMFGCRPSEYVEKVKKST